MQEDGVILEKGGSSNRKHSNEMLHWEFWETAVTATAGFLEKGHISSAASLVHEVFQDEKKEWKRPEKKEKA